jgi:hypothetical protein
MHYNADELVEVYLNIRNARDQLRAEYEEQDGVLRGDMDKLEAQFLDICNTVGANSINTQHGTVIRSLKERYTCNDWDNFKKFIKEHDALDCLEKRIHAGNLRILLKDLEDEGLPPGVSVLRQYDISVRKSSK